MSSLPPHKPPDLVHAGHVNKQKERILDGAERFVGEEKKNKNVLDQLDEVKSSSTSNPSEEGMSNSHTMTYSSIARSYKPEHKVLKTDPLWGKIFLDWKDTDGKCLRGFCPRIEHYKKIFESLGLSGDEVRRINDCKSEAGYIIIEFKNPLNVITKFESVNGPVEVTHDVTFSIRGLESMRAAQSPIEVIIKNGSETNLQALQEIMMEYGDIVGDFESVPHSLTTEKEEDKPFSKIFNNIMSGKTKFLIKPKKKLPMIIPVRGRKVELFSILQQVQCYKCLKFGHTKAKCQALNKISYSEFERNFRFEVGLPIRIGGEEERKSTEEIAQLEEEEESLSHVRDDASSIKPPLGNCGKIENKKCEIQTTNIKQGTGLSSEKTMKTASLRDDWTKVMQKRTSTQTFKNNGEQKKNKRAFNSPEIENNKRTRDLTTNSQSHEVEEVEGFSSLL